MMDDDKYVSWWGITPAVDFFEELANGGGEFNLENILVIGGSDCRHILKTIASPKRKGNQQLDIYIIENCLELYARQLLLLGIAFESPSVLSVQDKISMFLEVYGNTLVRPQTYEYIKNKPNDLIRILIDSDYRSYLMPFINLDCMLFRELDCLESIFKMWKNLERNNADIRKFWDNRLRRQYGVRYDSRSNLYDYDFSMKLSDINAGMIGYHKYCNWRNTGIAFDQRYGNYLHPNKTICSGLADHHLKYKNTIPYPDGYWGDIISSPYLAFGIECDNENLLKMENDRYLKNGEEISTYNVQSMMEKIEMLSKDQEIPISTWLKMNFISKTHLGKLHHYSQKKFDLIYVSYDMAHTLTPALVTLFQDNAIIIIETCKFVLDYRSQQHTEFKNGIEGITKEINFHELKEYDPMFDAYAKFKRM